MSQIKVEENKWHSVLFIMGIYDLGAGVENLTYPPDLEGSRLLTNSSQLLTASQSAANHHPAQTLIYRVTQPVFRLPEYCYNYQYVK